MRNIERVKDTFWENLAKPSPHAPGTRIRLINMPDDPNPIAPGTCGTVLEFSNGAYLSIEWDDGRSLNLALDIDTYEVI